MAGKVAAIVVASPTRRSTALNQYVRKPKKGQRVDRFVASSGINGAMPAAVEVQMGRNRTHWGKDGTRTVTKDVGGEEKSVTEGQYVQAYHVIQSFARDGEGSLDPEDPGEWERGHQIGVELARTVAGENRFAAVTTQIDGTTGCIHNHVVIDSVDKRTGRSFDSSHLKHKNLVKAHDGMLTDLGYQQVNPEYQPEGTQAKKAKKTLEKSELRAYAAHENWDAGGRRGKEPFSVAVMRQRIEEALEETSFTTFEEFTQTARAYDLDVQQRGEGGRGISYGLYTLNENGEPQLLSNSKRRASKLGTNYMMDAVERAAQRNHTMQAQTQTQQPQTQPTAVREIPDNAFSGYDGKPEPVILKMQHRWSSDEIKASIDAWEAEHQEQAEARPIPAAALGADGRPSKFELMAKHGFSPEESDASIAQWKTEHEAQQDTEAAAEHSMAPAPSKPDEASHQAQATEQPDDAAVAAPLPAEDEWQQKARQHRERQQRLRDEIDQAEEDAKQNPDAELADRVVTYRAQDGDRTPTPGAMRDSGMGEVEVAAAIQSWITLRLPETASERAAAQESAPPQHRPEQPDPSADPVPVEESHEPAERPVETAEPVESASTSQPAPSATDEAEEQPETQRQVRDKKTGRTHVTEAEKMRRDLDRKLRREGLDHPGSGRDDPQLD